MLELRNICYSAENDGVKKDIIKNVSLKLDEKFIAFTGPNGGGKSTLAKIIRGIIKPTSGRIIFDGKDVTDLSVTDRAKAGIAFAFQQPVKFKGITVTDLIEIASGKKLSVSEICGSPERANSRFSTNPKRALTCGVSTALSAFLKISRQKPRNPFSLSRIRKEFSRLPTE